jgi:4-amino-4-deoxy-L-arabinose transferase-like glycosyltransferase
LLESSPTDEMRRAALFLVFTLALLTRLALFAIQERRDSPRFMAPDSFSYVEAAASLARHCALLDEEGRPTWGRVPIYPALLASLFVTGAAAPSRPEGAILVQILLGSGVVLAAAWLAFLLAGPAAGWVTGILLALEPSLIAYSNLILSEIPYALGLLLVMLAYRRWRLSGRLAWLLALALGTGLLPLIRQIGLYLPLLIIPLILAASRSGRGVAMGLAFLAIAWSPAALWSWRNDRLLGVWELHYTAPWGKALFSHFVEEAAGLPQSQDGSPGPKPWEYLYWKDAGASSRQKIEAENAHFRRVLLTHPLVAARLTVREAILMVGVPDSFLPELALDHPPAFQGGSVADRLRWIFRLGPLAAPILLGMTISVGGMLAIPAAWVSTRRRDRLSRDLLLLVIMIALYHVALSSFVPLQGERYRVPIIPLLGILLVVGAMAIARMLGWPVKAGSPLQDLPPHAGRVTPQIGAGAHRHRVSASLQDGQIRQAVPVGPALAPGQSSSRRIFQDSPDLLFPAAVLGNEAG